MAGIVTIINKQNGKRLEVPATQVEIRGRTARISRIQVAAGIPCGGEMVISLELNEFETTGDVAIVNAGP